MIPVSWCFGSNIVLNLTSQSGRRLLFSKACTNAFTQNRCVLGNFLIAYAIILSGPGALLFFILVSISLNASMLI